MRSGHQPSIDTAQSTSVWNNIAVHRKTKVRVFVWCVCDKEEFVRNETDMTDNVSDERIVSELYQRLILSHPPTCPACEDNTGDGCRFFMRVR